MELTKKMKYYYSIFLLLAIVNSHGAWGISLEEETDLENKLRILATPGLKSIRVNPSFSLFLFYFILLLLFFLFTFVWFALHRCSFIRFSCKLGLGPFSYISSNLSTIEADLIGQFLFSLSVL